MMTPSPYCTIGPFFPRQFSEGTADLTRRDGTRAQGQHIVLAGRVLELGGKPTVNTIVEIWQPDANGVFRHPLDQRCASADPGFLGWGRARTDAEGAYRFRTVLPGAYEGRCAHINLMLLAIGLTRRLTTTVFFSDHPEEVCDPVLECVPEKAARLKLFANRDAAADAEQALGYRFDILLRGENETPFFLD
jgi:protocatechuate 3,4-dioxygenase beta subunit